jgi:general secretion pathway protein A
MYNQFFKLKENPFSITADPEFFFSSTQHAEAYSSLLYGIENRKGIIVITGEVGTGKTTLCRTLLSHLDPEVKTALVLNPVFSPVQMLRFICKDFGIEGHFRNKFALIDALNGFLLEQSNQGHNVVLLIDEAQNLKPQQLEQVRLLSNLETEKDKLLQIILIGQPELQTLLDSPSLRQLNQRVTVRYHIRPLSQRDIKPYIKHRLTVAKDPDDFLYNVHFTPEAYEAIYHFSEGVPRLINIICDRALLAGFAAEKNTIDEDLITTSAQEIV